ncbi:MAG TPA: SurA N-terminal domain-containing protein [Streptosporangiaceae bacterium]|nr:SurA N-terminal domain-containing protein [Streptosporangiaceae bacterium]
MFRILNRRVLFKRSRAAGLAAAALGGCLALTGCGSVQLGAAAIVGGQRITTSTLTTQVSELTGYYNAHKAKVQLQFPASQTAQQVLAWLVRFQVRDQMASRMGITVSAGDIQRAITAITAEERQSGQTTSLTSIAVANGLPPDLVNPALGKYEAIQAALVSKLGGTGATSSAAQQALSTKFNHDQCLAAKSLRIKINPQFGALDYSELDIVAAADTLSTPQPGASPSPSASPSAKPQLTPPC